MTDDNLTAEEIEAAEKYWIKKVQELCFILFQRHLSMRLLATRVVAINWNKTVVLFFFISQNIKSVYINLYIMLN